MKYNISDRKIKIIVDELGEEYKDLLIEHLLDSMGETDADLINPSDLIRLDVTTKANLRNDRRTQHKNRMLSMIALVGLMYIFVGLMLMMWNLIQDIHGYDSMMMMSLTLMFIGSFVCIFAIMYNSMVKMKSRYSSTYSAAISPYEVINKWKEIEALVRELTPEESTLSFPSMMRNLKDTKIISDEDIVIIDKLRKFRNQISHDPADKVDLPQTELRKILLQADTVIAKMKKIL